MRLLILGGSRFIGRHVAEQAQAAGHEVVLFNRGQSWPEAPFETLQGDLHQLPDYATQLQAVKADVVLHCLAMTPQHAHDFVNVFQHSSAQLHVLSSADVYEAFQGLAQGKENSDWPVSEASPVTPKPFYWRDLGSQHMQDYDKNQVTEIVLQACPRAVVYRLPMVYGPHDRQYAHRHGWILQHLLHKQSEVVLGLSQQANLWHYGYVENIAAALLTGMQHTLDHPGQLTGVYNLGETQVRSWRRWVELFYQAAGRELTVRLLPDNWPISAVSAASPAPQHFFMDVSRFANTTGFEPPVTVPEAIARTLRWGLAHPEGLGECPDFEGRLKAWRNFQNFLTSQVSLS